MDDRLKNSFCVIPWLEVTAQTNGDLKGCCQMVSYPFGVLKDEDGNSYNAKSTDINIARNSPLLKSIRKEMLSGKLPEICSLCKSEEQSGINSKRIGSNYKYYGSQDFLINNTDSDGAINTDVIPTKQLDLRLGNLCNLKCRYCAPADSSSWYDDFGKVVENGQELSSFNFPYFEYKDYEFKKDSKTKKWTLDTDDFNWPENSVLLDSLLNENSQIDSIYFTGGEPTLIKDHWKLLDGLVNLNKAKDISLSYNTNTTYFNEAKFEIWKNFKQVNIGCSIDACGDLASYLRPPVKWEVIEKNLNSFFELGANIRVHVSATVSVYNLINLKSLVSWLIERNRYEQFAFHFVNYPDYCNAQILPLESKKLLEQSYKAYLAKVKMLYGEDVYLRVAPIFQSVLNHVNADDKSDLIRKFYRETQKLDEIRGHSFYKIAPEVHQLLSPSI